VGNDLFQQEPQANESSPLQLQPALQEHEEQLKELMKTANSYVSALKRWLKACQTGHIGDMQKAMDQALKLAQEIEPRTGDAKASWSFDIRRYLETDAWIREMQQELAEKHSRRARVDENNNLICSPVLVRSLPGQNALQIGKKRWVALRPEVVAKELKRLRDHLDKANVQDLVEALYAKWERHKKSDDGPALLRDIYNDLAETPGWKRENPESKFGLDLYALHRSGITATRAGRPLEWIHPSGKYREKEVFTVVEEDGNRVRYYAIRFR
jgi:hypothetical protein